MRLWRRYKETIQANWHLGVTCFGGPAVQFQTVSCISLLGKATLIAVVPQNLCRRQTVDRRADGMSFASPRCGIWSTRADKHLAVSTNLLPFANPPWVSKRKDAALHQRHPQRLESRLLVIPHVQVTFLVGTAWERAKSVDSLPGAIGMYALGVGIGKVTNTLPAPAYALLSGLNAATVGVIALAGVKLAQRAVTDKITRLLVFLGGVMGMLYTALW